MNFIYVPLIALVCALFQIYWQNTLPIETILMYLLFISVGFQNLISFYPHGFRGEQLAKSIGWPIGSPFQWEIACVSLAFGVLGILCYWFSGLFWLATIVGFSIFMWGAAYGHIKEIVTKKNYSPGNAGIVLYYDIIMPVVLISLYIAYALGQ